MKAGADSQRETINARGRGVQALAWSCVTNGTPVRPATCEAWLSGFGFGPPGVFMLHTVCIMLLKGFLFSHSADAIVYTCVVDYGRY